MGLESDQVVLGLKVGGFFRRRNPKAEEKEVIIWEGVWDGWI